MVYPSYFATFLAAAEHQFYHQEQKRFTFLLCHIKTLLSWWAFLELFRFPRVLQNAV
jgi:hypothetical protein